MTNSNHKCEADSIDDIDWCRRLLSKLGHQDFFASLPAFVAELWTYDFCMIFYYPVEKNPVSLFDGLTPEGYGDGVENYLKETYVINPFYRSLANGLDSGLYSMGDLALQIGSVTAETSSLIQQDSNEESGFITTGWPQNATEVTLAVPLVDKSAIEVAVSRLESAGGEMPQQDNLRHLAPVLVTAIQKHVELKPDIFKSSNEDTSLAVLLEDEQFGKLTRREFEIVELILSGYSSPAIADHLYIALPTVKTHRRNIFRKLDISAQVELFSRVANLIAH